MTTILVVDDDDQIRRAVTRILSMHGFDCRAVGTIGDALAGVAADAPDVVLMDVELGTSSGLAIHRALRATRARHPAVIFTTSRRDVFATMLEQLGPLDDWIVKPWDPAEFIARVRLAATRVVMDRAASTGA